MSNHVVSFVVKLVNQTVAPVKKLVDDLTKVGKSAGDAAKPVKAAGDALNKMVAPATAAAKSAKAAADGLKGTVQPAKASAAAVDTAGDKADAAGKKYRGLATAVTWATRGLIAVNGAVLAQKAAVTAAVASLLMWTRGQTDATLANARAAQAAGWAFQAYQALSYAYQQNGLDVGQLDASTKALARSYGLAIAGSKQQVAAFHALGVKLRDVNGHKKTSEVLLSELANGFAKSKDSITKTNLAMAIFGDQGAALIPLLDQGAAGIKQLTDRARALGLVIGDQALKDAQKFDDSWSKLTDTFVGVKNSIFTGVLPSMTALVDKLVAIVNANKVDILKGVKDGLAWLTKNLPGILSGTGKFVDFLKGVVSIAIKVVKAVGGINTALSICGVILVANVLVGIYAAVTGFIAMASALWGGIVAVGTFAADLLATAVPAVWAFTAALLANPMTWIVVAIVAVVGALVWMAFHWKLVTKTVGQFWGWMKTHFPFLTGFVQPFIDAAGYVVSHWSDVTKFFGGLWDTIKSIFSKIAGVWNNLPGPLRGFLAGTAAVAFGGPAGALLAPDIAFNAARTPVAQGNNSWRGQIDLRLAGAPFEVTHMSSPSNIDMNTNRGLMIGPYF